MKDDMLKAFDKTKAVIDSCETLEQFETAKKMVEQFEKLYRSSGGGVHTGYLQSRLNQWKHSQETERKCYFISGHRDVTELEFTEHYIPSIMKAIDEGARFVVGDCVGVDDMAQRFLESMSYPLVTVYHMFESPRYHVKIYPTNGGWKSDVDRDWAMTLASDIDLCWVREGKERSGTAQNVWRRGFKEDGVTSIVEVMTRDAEMFL